MLEEFLIRYCKSRINNVTISTKVIGLLSGSLKNIAHNDCEGVFTISPSLYLQWNMNQIRKIIVDTGMSLHIIIHYFIIFS